MAQVLLGKPVIDALEHELMQRISSLTEKGVTPTLAIIRVGERPDDLSYERTALKRAEKLGIAVKQILLPANAEQGQLMDAIQQVNHDTGIHGCLMFRPLPNHLDEEAACEALDPSKDVDGIGRGALASVFVGRGAGFAPCTAAACIEMLDAHGVSLPGKKAVVVGRSLVVGRPMAMLLLERNATVTMCHTYTEDLESAVQGADIVVFATGRAKAYGANYFRPGQTVLDVGINVDAGGNLCGDVDFEAVEPIVEAITPVPRGIGGVTTSVLMKHVVEAAERSLE